MGGDWSKKSTPKQPKITTTYAKRWKDIFAQTGCSLWFHQFPEIPTISTANGCRNAASPFASTASNRGYTASPETVLQDECVAAEDEGRDSCKEENQTEMKRKSVGGPVEPEQPVKSKSKGSRHLLDVIESSQLIL